MKPSIFAFISAMSVVCVLSGCNSPGNATTAAARDAHGHCHSRFKQHYHCADTQCHHCSLRFQWHADRDRRSFERQLRFNRSHAQCRLGDYRDSRRTARIRQRHVDRQILARLSQRIQLQQRFWYGFGHCYPARDHADGHGHSCIRQHHYRANAGRYHRRHRLEWHCDRIGGAFQRHLYLSIEYTSYRHGNHHDSGRKAGHWQCHADRHIHARLQATWEITTALQEPPQSPLPRL